MPSARFRRRVTPGVDNERVVFRMSAVSKLYRMGDVEVQALRSVDLDLYAGELVALLGVSPPWKTSRS
jgi:putative ABC transport system ATP-binding protein